jgi:hypothetical protein
MATINCEERDCCRSPCNERWSDRALARAAVQPLAVVASAPERGGHRARSSLKDVEGSIHPPNGKPPSVDEERSV